MEEEEEADVEVSKDGRDPREPLVDKRWVIALENEGGMGVYW